MEYSEATRSRWVKGFEKVEYFEYPFCLMLNRLAPIGLVRYPFTLISRLGDGNVWVVLGLMLPLFHGADGWNALLMQILAAVIGGVFYRLVKERFRRERPAVRYDAIGFTTPPLDRFSFPSGHTLHAVCFYTVISGLLPVWGAPLLPLVCAIALSRVVLGLHFPSDVAVGGFFGWIIGSSVVTGYQYWLTLPL